MKKIVSFILALVMLLSILPVEVLASEPRVTFTVENASAQPNGTVDITVRVDHNIGVLSANLEFTFGDELTLIAAEAGEAFDPLKIPMTAPAQLTRGENVKNIARFMWQGTSISDADVKNGIILRMTFMVNENAVVDKDYPINLRCLECCDRNAEDLETETVNGYVTIIDYLPGDANRDKKISTKDVIWISRYIVDGLMTDPEGYNVSPDEKASNVNGDEKISTKDVIWISRYIVDGLMTDPEGYNIKLFPAPIVCAHKMEATAAKEATCEENGNIAYWHCTECDKYYKDADGKSRIAIEDAIIEPLGHDIVIDPAVEPTYTSTGKTEGSHCARCHEILVAQEERPKLQKDEYAITYYVNNSDTYLASLDIENKNPTSYTGEKTITLTNLHVDGYQFDGWFNGEGSDADRILRIPEGSEGNIELYAHWTEKVYTISFTTPFDGHGVEDKTYTVSKGATLPKPYIGGYAFLGWTNENADKWITNIPKGTFGNITLEGTWTSLRNRTKPVSKLGDPEIVTDSENGEILFIYYIGDIENVPLYQIGGLLQNVDGLATVITETTTHALSTEEAAKVSKSTSKATTNSEAWSLSQQWNDVTSVDESWCESHGVSKTDAESWCRTSTDTVSINSTNGGATSTVDSSGYSGMASTTNSNSHSNTDETAIGMEVSLNSKVSGSASVGNPAIANASASYEMGASIGANASNKSINTGTQMSGITSNDGWTEDHCSTNQATWSQGSGYSHSDTTSHSQSTSKTISDVISKAWGFSSSHEEGGGVGQDVATSSTNAESNEYSTTITYNVEDIKQESKQVSTSGEKDAYYRLVCAGKEHVFAVVGYSVADASYYTYTYAVTDTETEQWIDQSLISTSFDDNENGVLPFEIPYFVKEYVDSRIAKTDGLQVNLKTGTITGYTGSDSFVYVPDFWRIDNYDGTYTSVKIRGIEANAFAGNKNIHGIRLSNYVNEIPANAFSGCSSLEAIFTRATIIGDRAFSGCISLDEFTISSAVTSLGKYVFCDVSAITVTAANLAVAQAATTAGAKSITLDISNLTEDIAQAGGATISIRGGEVVCTPSWISKLTVIGYGTEADMIENQTKYFELRGKRLNYDNLKIISGADTTILNGVIITESTSCPITIKSDNLTLNQVEILCPGIAMKLLSDHTNISVYGTNMITSECGEAIACREVSAEFLDDSVFPIVRITGNINLYGNIDNVSGINLLDISNGSIKSVDERTYVNFINEVYQLVMDKNNPISVGSGTELIKIEKYFGIPIGSLPVPELNGYSFLGWFTEPTDGVLVSESTVFKSFDTVSIYAHWNQDTVSVTFDPADGNVTETVRNVSVDTAIGTLPVPTRTGYKFLGWFCGEQEYTADSMISNDITLTAKWEVLSYTATWNRGIGYNIVVERTTSPNANAELKVLSSGSEIYYGDVLKVTYTAATNYSLTNKGKTDITVTGNVTAADVYATAKCNEVLIGTCSKAEPLTTNTVLTYYVEYYKIGKQIRVKGWVYDPSNSVPVVELYGGWNGDTSHEGFYNHQFAIGTADKSNVSFSTSSVPSSAQGHMFDFLIPVELSSGSRVAIQTNYEIEGGHAVKIADSVVFTGDSGLIF